MMALAGCGGSDPDDAGDAARQGSPPPEERFSRAQARYVERFDAACKQGNEFSDGVTATINTLRRRPVPKAETNKEVVKLLDASQAASNVFRDRIRKLRPPPGEERFHRRYNAYSDRLATLNKVGRDAIARGDDLAPLRLKANLVTKRRRALVGDHGGFRYCG